MKNEHQDKFTYIWATEYELLNIPPSQKRLINAKTDKLIKAQAVVILLLKMTKLFCTSPASKQNYSTLMLGYCHPATADVLYIINVFLPWCTAQWCWARERGSCGQSWHRHRWHTTAMFRMLFPPVLGWGGQQHKEHLTSQMCSE